MKITKPQSSADGNFEKTIVPAGTHVARLYRIVDLGTHYNEKFDKSSRQLELSWEFPLLLHTFKEENGAQPLVVSKTVTRSLHEKSGLTKLLKSWGVDISEDTFEMSQLFDIPCLLAVSHNVVGDKTYVNVDSAVPIPAGMDAPAPIKDNLTVDLEEFDHSAYGELPEWMQEKIASTKEGKAALSLSSDSAVGEDELPV